DVLYNWDSHEDLRSFPTRRSSDLGALEERLDQVDRRREDDRRGVRAADLQERLQVAQLQRNGVLLDHERRVLEPLVIEEHPIARSEEHTSELQSRGHLVCRLLLEK